jgi:hypothetical protein
MRCGRGDVIDNGSNAIIYYRVLSTVIRLVLIKKHTRDSCVLLPVDGHVNL